MNDSNKKLNMTHVWKSLVVLVAFICCGFLFNSFKISAAHFAAIPDKAIVRDEATGKVKSFTVYVGFDGTPVNSVKFTFSTGKTWSAGNVEETKKNVWDSKDVTVMIHGEKYRSETAEYRAALASSSICNSMEVTCTSTIVAYTIQKLSSFGISDDFTVDVNAANTTFLIGWKNSASKSFDYDNKAPSVSSVSVSKLNSAQGGLLNIGQKIQFKVVLSESSKVSSGVKLGFSINGVSKSAGCLAVSSTSSFYCYYTIVEGDGGNSDSARQITNVKLTGANNIKDVSGNAMSSTVSGFTFDNGLNVRIDADKPTITSIDVQTGVFSASSSIKMTFTFSENLKSISGYNAPVAKVKFGAGNVKTCSFSSIRENKMDYNCTPSSTDQGVFAFVSISGGSGLSDEAGNVIDLNAASKTFSNTTVNNNIPSISDIVIEPQECKVDGVEYYCATGKRVKITFKFDMASEIKMKSVTIKFGNVSAKNSLTSTSSTTGYVNFWEIVYTIASGDGGKMSLQYSFSLNGNNGQANTISASMDDCGVYVDNKSPIIESLEAYVGEEKLESNTIYSKPGVEVKFKVYIDEVSQVTLNSNGIVLLDEFNNEISVNSNVSYGISGVEVNVKDKVVYVTIVIKGECDLSFKLKILKNSLTDSFGNGLSSDYYSNLYKVDTKGPEFSVELVYPEHGSYYINNTKTLISGNSLQFKISSKDADLKDYCVVGSTKDICEEFNELVLNDKYLYSFENKGSGNYSFYVRVRDNSLSTKDVLVEFSYKNVFTYSNADNKVAKSHKVTIDVSMFDDSTTLKYAWFAKNSNITFNNAAIVNKETDSIVVEAKDMNGEYKLCLNNANSGDVLCGEYLVFDSKIDLFDVNVSNDWSSDILPVNIEYMDSNPIKCIAIGKDEPNVSCQKAVNSNVVIYRTNQLVSPFNAYSVSESGVYYFYIEDIVGNSKLITKTISNIDKDKIQIDVYNGQVGEYNTNLEIEYYKSSHSFLITFDKDISVGSKHVLYKYFFSVNNYAGIKSRNAFDSYYLGSLYKEEINNCNKSLKINTPSVDGIYNLYIMAIDQAGNESFKTVNGIKVDASGPSIKMYNSNGVATSGGSNTYIAVFDYSVVIEDRDSKLNLNTIKYKWVDSANNVVVEKNYDKCSFYSNVCTIAKEEIGFETGVFSPNEKYRFVVSAVDNAGNSSVFTSNSFMIDTMAPVININVDENKWYENGDISFSVTKTNTGTLDTIAYCLNDCFTNNVYDLSKFKIINFTNGRVVEHSVSLKLVNGLNEFYVYASDIFGNHTYDNKVIKYDKQKPVVIINNLNQHDVVDFMGFDEDKLNLDVTINDDYSGVSRYCIYYKEYNLSKDCFDHNGDKNVSKLYRVDKNGIYVVEVRDIALNVISYEVSVIGIDTTPVEFDLVRDVKAGQYVNGNVIISLVNMRKFMVDNVEDRIASIDYVKLAYDSVINSYEDIFDNYVVNSIYSKVSSNSLVTNFIATENKTYVVRVVDTAGNVSYNYIKINCIDKDAPFINTNKYPNNSERIYVNTSSGKNLRVFVKDDGVSKVYKYSNDVINVYFGSDSLKDLFTGYNDYLGLKVCFEEDDCVYNTYAVNSSVIDGYLSNSSLIVNVPYNFSGVIRYYLVDGAGNESFSYSFEVEYQNEVSEVEISINDVNGEAISDVKKYSKVTVVLSGEEINDIIFNNSIKYALVNSNINLHNQLANYGGSISSFFTTYNFNSVVNSTFEVSKINDEGEYYLWIYVVDLLGNVKLMKASSLIRLDSVAPNFGEISLNINKIDNTNYDISINHFVDGYSLYLDSNNDGVYEILEFVNDKAGFSVSGLDNVNFKLVDEAGNFKIQSFSLNISSGAYARVYQVGNTRELNVVVYNLGNKNVTSFRYIVDGIGSIKEYDENTINDDTIVVCNGYGDEICKGTITDYVEKGVYNLNLTSFGKDKKVVLYIYVDGNLIDIVEKDVLVDNEKPQIVYKEENPSVISTVNGNNYEFIVEVEDANISNLMNKKYILTMQYNISLFDFEYNSCLNIDTCSRGLFNLSSNEGVIAINSNVNRLVSGTYYLYVYIEDDFGNAQVGRSSAIYVDNSAPIVKYAISNQINTYHEITDEVYVGGAVKLKISDNHKVNYFRVYEEGTLTTVCYIENSKLDTNCIRNSYGATGLVFENGEPYYYLDNGNYSVKVYDYANNVEEVYINIDAENPVINLYKEVEGDYLPQLESGKIYSDLSNLYINVRDDNFYYLTVDLRNTITNNNVIMASRYSYNSEVGKCLVDASVCEHGVSLVSIIEGNTFNYNNILIKVYDRANRSSTFEINYDDSTPEIWMLDEGESVYIDGVLYTLEMNNIINVEIGVNPNLTTDLLLSKIVLSVDGMSYSQAKNTEFFKVEYFKNGNLFTNDLCKYIGNYVIKLSYMDIAGNEAVSKEIRINVVDNTKPIFNVLDEVKEFELKEEVTVKGVKVQDNYGLKEENGYVIKEINMEFSDASCFIEVSGNYVVCTTQIIKVGNGIYKFVSAGTYKFIYSATDLAGNSSTIEVIVTAVDNQGPEMSSSVDNKTSFTLYFGDRNNNSVNIENITLNYPNSFDKGDQENKIVEYVGLFGVNNMGEKYRINDTYLIANSNNAITYKFTKTGIYYLRFSSVDKSGNVSLFEYEVKTQDIIAPVITGISNGQIIKLGIEESFSVEYLLEKYSITVSDNYDSNVKIYYELNKSTTHSHEILLTARDSSLNAVNITIYVDIEDYTAPEVGELMLPALTNQLKHEFVIVGGSDNSSNWWHEYSIQGGTWNKIKEDTYLEFGVNLSQNVQVCIKAVDAAGNISLNQSCKIILVDTKVPDINGIKDGEIALGEVNVSVSDERLDMVEVWFEGTLLSSSNGSEVFKFVEIGKYQIVARDTLGNEVVASFMISIDKHVNIVTDINADEYTTNTIEFDKRFLVKVDVNYDNNGYSNIYAKIDNVNIKANDVLYILGVIPGTDSAFVIFSVNGVNISNYSNGINLIGNGNIFKQGINNEDCFVKFNDYYYAYAIVKENASKDPVAVVDDNKNDEGNNGFIKGLFIVFGAAALLFVGYQLIKFRKKVRAA